MTYQQKALRNAFAHVAQALACAALGDARGVVAHGKAVSAWTAVVVAAQAAVKAGVPQWMLDAHSIADEWAMLESDDVSAN